jgi:dihydroflavonol-4-reductase
MGFRHLFRHKIAPTPLFQMIYDMDAGFPLVHVEDVADAAFRAATHSGLHGRHYLISKETWRVSDVSRMLNNQEPLGLPVVRVSGELSSRELGLHYKPVAEALGGA